MTEEQKINIEIEKSKTEYSPIWRISNEVFTDVASKVLNIDKDFLQIRRCIMTGKNWGKLTVFVFNDKEEQYYYSLYEGEKAYRNLPSNIDDFKSALANKI